MPFPIHHVRLGMMALAVAGMAGYAWGHNRKAASLVRLIPALYAAYALAHVLFMAFLWVNHAAFPLNLEAMELPVREHLERLMAGQAIYMEPAPEFVALTYTPLYYYITMPFALVLGPSLFALRLVAIVGMALAGAMVYLIVRRHSNSNWWGLMAIGLYAAAYRVMDTYLDNAHADSWLLLSVLLGCYLIERRRSQGQTLLGVAIVAMAFWFKQTGAVFAIGAVAYLMWRDGWRKAWPALGMALLLGPIAYAGGGLVLGPRFHYFTWEIPRQWTALNFGTVRRLGGFIAKSYPLLAISGLLIAARSWQKDWRNNIWYAMLLVACVSGFMGALDSESNNNVFIPMGVWFIITGVLAFAELAKHKWGQRYGLHLLAIGVSFALLVYDPVSVIASPRAGRAYEDLLNQVHSLEGPVYAPWLGKLPGSTRPSPAPHWVPMVDLVRGHEADWGDSDVIHDLLQGVIHPEGKAYILMNFPLENDPALAFLGQYYTLQTDFGERFSALGTLPKRFNLRYPRYLYVYGPAR